MKETDAEHVIFTNRAAVARQFMDEARIVLKTRQERVREATENHQRTMQSYAQDAAMGLARALERADGAIMALEGSHSYDNEDGDDD